MVYCFFPSIPLNHAVFHKAKNRFLVSSDIRWCMLAFVGYPFYPLQSHTTGYIDFPLSAMLKYSHPKVETVPVMPVSFQSYTGTRAMCSVYSNSIQTIGNKGH